MDTTSPDISTSLSVEEIHSIRAQFPLLSREVHSKPLVFLDNAASSQMPLKVMNRIKEYHVNEHANVHRGVHYLSQTATDSYEQSREVIQKFIGASKSEEIIFTSGTTDAINVVASSLASNYFQPGDEILISEMEHHSNIVPWQIHAVSRGAVLKTFPVNDRGEIIVEEFEKRLSSKTKFVGVTHISNVMGTINPIKELIRLSHEYDIPVLIDGAQAAPHTKVNVQELDCDFYVFSAHKMFGPTGFGILYGKSDWLNKMNPVKGGGDMIQTVSFEGSTWNDLPYKFEAGTPNISGAIGLAASVNFISEIGIDKIKAHEDRLLAYATEKVLEVDGVSIFGTAAQKASIISFLIEDIHPHDIGTILDLEGVAIRAGHHCAQPLMDKFGIPATSRASFAVYNTFEEIDLLVDGIYKVKSIFA